MYVRVITDINEFHSLKDDWTLLFNNSVECYPMMSHTWLCAWWESFPIDDNLYIITVWSDDNIIAAAPLMYKKVSLYGRQRKVISFLSNEWVDRITFLLRTPIDIALKTIIDHLYNKAPKWDLIILRPMAEDSCITETFIKLIKNKSKNVGVENKSLSSPLSYFTK